MRWLLALCPLLLAGCLQQGPSAVTSPPNASGFLPPSLLLDTGAEEGRLQVYVHAAPGNVRYDFLNLTQHAAGDLDAADAAPAEHVTTQAEVYALSMGLEPAARYNITVEAVAGAQHYTWAARWSVNKTAMPILIALDVMEPKGWSRTVNVTLPYETLLAAEAR